MSDIRIFENEQFGEMRTVMQGGEPWFVAADVCRVLEIEPTATRRLDDDERNTLRLTQGTSGNPNVVIVNEAGLYSLVIGSRKPEARAFKRWITHEVLPSIRKHGAYITTGVLEQLMSTPDFGIRLFSELKHEREARWALEVQANEQGLLIEAMTPKANYCDRVLQSVDLVPISVIAKDYGMSGRAFNALLHDLGVQYRVGDIWMLYQEHACPGYAHSTTQIIHSGKSIMFTAWTQKGRLFRYELLKKHGILPMMERRELPDAR